jgi:hypothetical protein
LDQSGNHNDAMSAGTPVIHQNAIGGHPAAHFNGATDYFFILDSASLRFSTHDFVVGVVAAHTTPTTGIGYGLFYAKQNPDVQPFYGASLQANSYDPNPALINAKIWAQVALLNGAVIETSETDYNHGQPLYLILHRASAGPGTATLSLRVNGADAASATGTGYAIDVSATGFPASIGGTPANQDVLGDVAEVVAIEGAVSDSDIGGLEGYFKTKYQL